MLHHYVKMIYILPLLSYYFFREEVLVMSNTIDSFCKKCRRYTYFVFDGEDWECQTCGGYNTQSDSSDPETPYKSHDD